MINEKIFTRQSLNKENFLKVAQNYLESHRDIPVLIADSSPKFEHDSGSVKIYFYDELLTLICNDLTKFEKDLRCMAAYGYRGQSRGGKNGLVVIQSRDKHLIGIINRFANPKYSGFCNSIRFSQDEEGLIGVKAVTHRKSGERIVGVLNRLDWRAVLYDIRTYSR